SSLFFFSFTATSPTSLFTLSLHDALPISCRVFCQILRVPGGDQGRLVHACGSGRGLERGRSLLLSCHREDHVFRRAGQGVRADADRKSTRLNSSHRTISYAVFCLKKKK